jgi:hypothetical protein
MRGRGSAGRASPCQGEGRGFESRRPLGASLAQSLWGEVFPGGVAERRGNGLQIRVHGFKSRLHLGRLAQWERASLTRKRSLVQIQYRPPVLPLVRCTLRQLPALLHVAALLVDCALTGPLDGHRGSVAYGRSLVITACRPPGHRWEVHTGSERQRQAVRARCPGSRRPRRGCSVCPRWRSPAG